MKLTKIRQQGYKAVINALGVAGTLRFLQQLEVGYGHQWLNQLTIDDFRGNFISLSITDAIAYFQDNLYC
ncbi:hypothetical protein MEO94_31745 [Dolichospermum sp. ST_sed9]|nr:hypothetical protein [Dolichospermum sp. ST_sed9]